MLHGLIAINWGVRDTGGESIQKYLAVKDANSANNKNHPVCLRYFALFAAKKLLSVVTASKASEHLQDNSKCQASCLL